MNIHAIQAGRLLGNKTAMRGTGWLSAFRRRVNFKFPAYVYIIDHPEGLIAIDTGMNVQVREFPLPMRRIFPSPIIEGREEEIGPQMIARGLNPEEVNTVIITHLDLDHAGGVRWFPDAEVLVHRPDYEIASTFLGKIRYRPHVWPADFEPTLYELDPEPYGPFPRSKAVTEREDLHIVPLQGHMPGQVGVILEMDEVALFFTADHTLRQDWFIEDWAAGRLIGLGHFFPEDAVATSRRIRRFTEQVPTVVLPAHDTYAPSRLKEMETIRFDEQKAAG